MINADGDLDQAELIVAGGGVIAIPTDTVYGLACDPRCPPAVERIYRIKRRPADLELTLLVARQDVLDGMVVMNSTARSLATRFWPGPLSMVLPTGEVSLAVPRRGTTLCVRVPDNRRLLDLLGRTGPLATTSANRHGEPAATTAAEVAAQLGGEVDAILEAGHAAGGVASTIIDCAAHPPRLLRDGPISLAELRPYLGGPQQP